MRRRDSIERIARKRRRRGWGAAACLALVVALASPVAGQDDGGDTDLATLLDDAHTSDREPAASPAPAVSPAATPAASPAPAASPTPAAAVPEPPRGKPERVIEEIIVTAQKREERLQDVPISMSVLDEQFLAEQNIADFESLAAHVPNVHVDVNGVYIQPRIRGVSTEPLNRGFEQAVALVVDGIPYGRGEYFDTALFDVERVEVLRGPQGTLFGKNTTVGLIHSITRRPTDDLTGFFDVQYGELDRRRVQAGIGGPLLPGVVNFRIAGFLDERDGYIENTTHRVVARAHESQADRERRAVRLKLELPDLYGADLLLGYERGDVDYRGGAQEIRRFPVEKRPFLLQFDPDTDFVPGNYVFSKDGPERSTRTTDLVTAAARYDLGGFGLDALAGWSRLDADNFFDPDGGPMRMIEVALDERSPQTTVELRVSSPTLAGILGLDRVLDWPLGGSDFTAGFFYQRTSLRDVDFVVDLNGPLLGAWIAYQRSPDSELPDDLPSLGGGADDEGFERNTLTFTQDSDQIAGFGQLNWHPAEAWTVFYGMRLSHDRKEASWVQVVEPETAVVIRLSSDDFEQDLDRSEFHFAPRVGAIYDWTDDVAVFATWARSFRAGGFNVLNAEDDPEMLRFEPETVRSWELGTKTKLLGGTALLHVGLFHMNLENFQLNTTEQDLSRSLTQIPVIVNVGELRARGVEADVTWLPNRWLTLRSGLGFDDTEFLDFPIGTCEIDRPNTDDDDDARCDLTGGPLPRAPKWTLALMGALRAPIMSLPLVGAVLPTTIAGIDLTGGFSVRFEDTQFLGETLDPRRRQGSFFVLDARLGIASGESGWSLGVSGENLTNQVVATRIDSIVQAPDTFVHYVQPPRLFFGGFRWDF